MSRYIFQDGGDATGEDTFNSYIDQLLASQKDNSSPQSDNTPTQEESAYIKSLRDYDTENVDNQAMSELTSRLDSMQSILDQQLQGHSQQQQEIDWYGSDDSNDSSSNCDEDNWTRVSDVLSNPCYSRLGTEDKPLGCLSYCCCHYY